MQVALTELGKNLTFFVATCNVDATGVITANTQYSLTGKSDGGNMRLNNVTENIMSLDGNFENNVVLYGAWELNLRAIRRRAGSVPVNTLSEAFIFSPSDYVLAVVTTPIRTWTFVGPKTDFSWDFQRGKNTDSITIKTADIGSANPTVA